MTESTPSRYLPFLERVLTPARLQHSLGVMQVMGELAPIYSLDKQSALTAGLLHDTAKDLSPEQVEKLVLEAQVEFRHPCEHDYVLYLHGPAARQVMDGLQGHPKFRGRAECLSKPPGSVGGNAALAAHDLIKKYGETVCSKPRFARF